MSVSMQVNENVQAMGYTFPAQITLEADGGNVKSITLAAAKVGQLTTRTDANTGELTMAASHGISNSDRLDVYWDGGSRRGMTVGTVDGNDVPIDGGAGDDLPDNLTAVTAMVPQEEEFAFTGSNAEALAAFSQRTGTIVLAIADDTESTAFVLAAGVASTWTPQRDATVPTAGDAVVKAFFSHGDALNTSAMRVVALYD